MVSTVKEGGSFCRPPFFFKKNTVNICQHAKFKNCWISSWTCSESFRTGRFVLGANIDRKSYVFLSRTFLLISSTALLTRMYRTNAPDTMATSLLHAILTRNRSSMNVRTTFDMSSPSPPPSFRHRWIVVGKYATDRGGYPGRVVRVKPVGERMTGPIRSGADDNNNYSSSMSIT